MKGPPGKIKTTINPIRLLPQVLYKKLSIKTKKSLNNFD